MNDLLTWNTMQINLWKQIVEIEKLDKNDLDVFCCFSKFFREYYYKHNQEPSVQEILEHLNEIYENSGIH